VSWGFIEAPNHPPQKIKKLIFCRLTFGQRYFTLLIRFKLMVFFKEQAK